MDDYKDLKNHNHSWRVLEDTGNLTFLIETIESFFNCKVDVFPMPSRQILERYSIDILKNPRRGCYPISDDEVLIVGRILKNLDLVSAIGFSLKRKQLSESIRLLNTFESSLSGTLTKLFFDYFQNSTLELGDALIMHTITNHLSRGYFDYRQIRHLINYFLKLRTTSFEGHYFSTGVILTKALHDFERKRGAYRFGDAFELVSPFSIMNTNNVNKRIWYLADGKKSFFLGNKDLKFSKLFIIDDEYSKHNYLDSHSLSLTLKGGDALFKIENEKLFSINTAERREFLFMENQWKFRDYNILRKLIAKRMSTDEELIDSIIFYILQCSKNGISSILWFPNDIDKIDDLIISTTKNRFVDHEINLRERRFINHVLRYLSSDGVTVIDTNGILKYFGVIVDINKASISGVKGTGESAASVLAANGLSVKISQDGTIKIFETDKDYPLKF